MHPMGRERTVVLIVIAMLVCLPLIAGLGGCRREAIFDENSITYRRGSVRNLLILRTGSFHPDRLLAPGRAQANAMLGELDRS